MTGTQASPPAQARRPPAPFPSGPLDTLVSQGKGQAGVGGGRDCSNVLHAALPSPTLQMDGQVQRLRRQEREEQSDSSGCSDISFLYTSCTSYLES